MRGGACKVKVGKIHDRLVGASQEFFRGTFSVVLFAELVAISTNYNSTYRKNVVSLIFVVLVGVYG